MDRIISTLIVLDLVTALQVAVFIGLVWKVLRRIEKYGGGNRGKG